MARGSIYRSVGADGCYHAFDSERTSNKYGERKNKKIECIKDVEVCRTCTKKKCTGTARCVEKRKREIEHGDEDSESVWCMFV